MTGWLCYLVLFLLAAGCAGNSGGAQSPEGELSVDAPDSSCGEVAECEQVCEKKDSSACEWLGQLHETGDGVPQDYARASVYYDKACDYGSATACGHLAMMYDIGLAVPEDPGRAAELYGIACKSGSRWACTRQTQLSEE